MKLNRVDLHLNPGRLVFGPGAIGQLPGLLDAGIAYLIVTDPGLVSAGIAETVMTRLTAGGLSCHLFSGVQADPPVACVENGVEAAREAGCAGVIALGGGSAIDAAKCIALGIVDDTPLTAYADGAEITEAAPLYAVPTTAGTGSEATRGAVITDPDRRLKFTVRGPALLPKASILDPDLLAGLPPGIAAECGADALCHAVEAFVSRDANILTDLLAAEAITRIGRWLRPHAAHPGNAEAGLNMLLASHLAGQAFTNAGLGLVHAMAEPVGAAYHLSHGLACALYLTPVMAYNLPAAPEKFARIARLLGEETDGMPLHQAARLSVQTVAELFRDCGIPENLGEVGVSLQPTDEMVNEIMDAGCTGQNPRKAGQMAVMELLRAVA